MLTACLRAASRCLEWLKTRRCGAKSTRSERARAKIATENAKEEEIVEAAADDIKAPMVA